MPTLRILIEPFILWFILSFASGEFYFNQKTFVPQVKKYEKQDTQITKVTLTQKGYIQFLRYTADVPLIQEFTYCIWLKSQNFTYSHPLLSYSKNDRERLIRGWVGPFGKTINLEILNAEIYSVQAEFVENQWYHICQSWDSDSGAWILFLDGRIRETGLNTQLKKIPIPEGGDIVVGQEYTDFDKGLDDGIEGDIFGFNLVLSSASFNPPDKHTLQDYQLNELPPKRRQINLPVRRMQSQNYFGPQRRNSYVDYYHRDVILTPPLLPKAEEVDIPEVLGYFNLDRQPKGFLDFGKSVFQMLFGKEDEKLARYTYPKSFYVGSKERIMNNVQESYRPTRRSLGSALVVESYNNCAKRGGSPIEDEKLLISWTKTPVRVFGGALLKSVAPFCIKIS